MATNIKLALIFPLASAISFLSHAQFRLPTFDIEAKAGIGGFPSTSWDYLVTPVHAGIHVHLNQYLALGWIYYRAGGQISRDPQDNALQTISYENQELITGPSLRLSSGRSAKLRPYVSLSYTKVEVVTDFETFRQAGKVNAIGGSAGLLLKLGNRLYVNIVDVTVRKLSKELFWIDADLHLEFKGGLLYNISKKK